MKIINFFANHLHDDEIISKSSELAKFTTDHRNRYNFAVDCVLQPKSLSCVQKILQICNTNKIFITAQGGNTSLCGGAIPQVARSIIVSLARLNNLIDVNLIDNCLTVEAGMILQDVQQIAKNYQRFFPLSFASEKNCQIGGNIATNAGGVNVLEFGTMRNLVLGLEVVLPNGDIISHLQALHKNTSGYDLKQLFIGSEGTLGIITKASLKLFNLPQKQFTALVSIATVTQITKLFLLLKENFPNELTSFEIINKFTMDLSSHYSNIKIPIAENNWYVLFELSDFNDHILDVNILELLINYRNIIIAHNDSPSSAIWKLRKNISESQKKFGVSVKHDISLPIAKIDDFINKNTRNLQNAFPDCVLAIFGHFGDGSLHYNVFLKNISDAGVYDYEDTINRIVYEDVLTYGGAIAAEHGVGQLKNFWLTKMLPDYELKLMQQIKRQFDPNGIMNPGKIFDL